MAVLQAHKNEGDGNSKLKAQAYSKRLALYPRDAVVEVCGVTRKWFPEWYDMEIELEAIVKSRRDRLAWLEGGQIVSADELEAAAAARALDGRIGALIVEIADATKYGLTGQLGELLDSYEALAEPRHRNSKIYMERDRYVIERAQKSLGVAA